jgi:hypothetical protein
MQAGSPVVLEGAFEATGNKSFDTTCGGRSLPVIAPKR